MLVYFGGSESKELTGETSYANMSQIILYNIANQAMYTQTATGDVPQSRRGFCAGVVWAKDQSSYNIYLFGGFGSPNNSGLNDLYVLSIPSFQWISLWPVPQQFSFPSGRGWTSCNVFRESQMMIIGGCTTNTSVPDYDGPEIGAQHNTLLGQENLERPEKQHINWWSAPRENITGYRVPDQIIECIGGDHSGHATAKAPTVSWDNPDLARYLGTTFSAQSRSGTRPMPTTSATSQPTSRPPAKRPSADAIAGGAVGGAVVLIGIITGVFFCLRSRRRKRATQASSEPTVTSNPHNPNITQKSPASTSVLQGNALTSPTTAYSSQASPIPATNPWHAETHVPSHYQSPPNHYQPSPPSHHQPSDWTHPPTFPHPSFPHQQPYQQPYYPPPPDPSRSPYKEGNPQVMSVELPNVQSPPNAEMAQVSPVARRGW